MSQIYKGMNSLPGFPNGLLEAQYNRALEAQYPGLKEIFDNFLLVNKAPGDIRKDIIEDRNEFPVEAAIAVPDETGRLQVIARGENTTRRGDLGSLGHAEMVVLRRAMANGRHLPEGAILISSVEPCSMCASALHRTEGSEVIFGASQDDMRGDKVWVDEKMKPFQAEPEGYSAKEFLQAHNPDARVTGGYRTSEVLKLNY